MANYWPARVGFDSLVQPVADRQPVIIWDDEIKKLLDEGGGR